VAQARPQSLRVNQTLGQRRTAAVSLNVASEIKIAAGDGNIAPMATNIARRTLKDKLMLKAREIASSGACIGWGDVVRKFDVNEEATLRIWMTGRDKDEIDQLCDAARAKSRRR